MLKTKDFRRHNGREEHMNVKRLLTIRDIILAEPAKIDMHTWHGEGCGTTHCIAGWAVTLWPPRGPLAESRIFEQAQKILNLSTEQARHLFLLSAWPYTAYCRYMDAMAIPDTVAAAKIVADYIEAFIASKGQI